MKVSFSHVANILPRRTLKRTQRRQRKLEEKACIFTDNKEGLHDTRSTGSLTVGVSYQSSIHDFSQENLLELKLITQHDKTSLLQSCGDYHSKTNSQTNTRRQRKLEEKTRIFTDHKEGLHDTLSTDSLMAGESVLGSAGRGEASQHC